MEWWQTLLVSLSTAIVGSVISALITNAFSSRNEKRKLLRLEEQKRNEELKKEYDERPRLELKEFIDLEHGDVNSKCDCECLLLNIEKIKNKDDILLFKYDKKALDLRNLCCVDYIFENTGKTEIDIFYIVSNQQKTTSIIELHNRSVLIDDNIICYDAISDKRFIKPGERVSVKICSVKNKVTISPISAAISIYMQDINGNYWCQPLFFPTKMVENSNRTNHSEFRDHINIKTAIECFKEPLLW